MPHLTASFLLPRPIVELGLTLLVGLPLSTWASQAAAPRESLSAAGSIHDARMAPHEEGDASSESQRALDEAKAALASTPPNRDAARRALERATEADDDAMATAEAYFRLGFFEEEDRAFERALADQRACMAKAPYSNWARSARQRVNWISARSEGAFEPLARLQRVRLDPMVGTDPAAIEALARDADAFPPGRVRAEARMFVAEALVRMKRPEEAIALFRKVAGDPSSDSTDAGLARRDLLQAFVAVGQLDDAARQVRTFPAADPELSAQVRKLVHRRALRRTAIGELVLFAVVAVLGVARARMPSAVERPWSRRPLARVAKVLLSGLTMAATAFVLLDAAGAKVLDMLGL